MGQKLEITWRVDGPYSASITLQYTCILPFTPFTGMSIKFKDANFDGFTIGMGYGVTLEYLSWDLQRQIWLCDIQDDYNYQNDTVGRYKERAKFLEDNGWKVIATKESQ